MKKFLKRLIRFIFTRLIRTEIRGSENIPDGAFVVASNHLGIIDAVIVFHAIPREDLFVPVAEKWERIWFFRLLARHLDFIFIDRFNPDLKALRLIMDKMNRGQVLVIAPEGTRSRTGAMIEGRPGVSYLAARSGYPIMPVALAYTEDKRLFAAWKRLRRPHILVQAGPVFTLPPLPRENRDEALKQYTDEIMCRIAAMLPEQYWGVYADHPRLKELLASIA